LNSHVYLLPLVNINCRLLNLTRSSSPSPLSEENVHQMEVETEEERTELLNSPEDGIKLALILSPNAKIGLDGCYDYLGPSIQVETKPIWNEIIKLHNRGIKLRFITEVTKQNIVYCKEMMKYLQVRHLDAVKGNFGIYDGKHYLGDIIQKEGEPPKQLIYVNIKEFVKQQQQLFDSLWSRAVPAEHRIKEIEEGMVPDVIDILKDPFEIISIAYKLVRAAKDEILVIFHTANALLRQQKAGGIDLLVESALKYKTQVKILVPIEDKIADTINRLGRVNGIKIRNIEPPMQTRVTIIVTDRLYSLVVELKDDAKENTVEAIGLATYSNSKSTVLSYVSIFETLWRQSELREELMIRSLAQKDFISIAAHELRNPIQPILGLSDVLQRSEIIFDGSKEARVKQKEMIDIIARNAKRLQRLSEDILDVSRIDGRTLNLNKEGFVLAETIREMVKDYITEIRNSRKNINLTFSSSKKLESTAIAADKSRIKQVMSNLIDNAIKFTQEGAVSITIKTNEKYSNLIVEVMDNGTGIDSDIFPRLFTKFATKSEGGTGLGLYVSKGIIEAHGGRVWAENNSNGNDTDTGGGTGATFGFELPLS
jgi:two-component system, OmpR family, sensor histidine kinase VicK